MGGTSHDGTQLEAKVYAQGPAGPGGGVLLLHGMSDSPYSLRALGEALNERGYWVIGLRLPGHGTAPSGLLDVHWQDMAGAVRLAAVPGLGGLAWLNVEPEFDPYRYNSFATNAGEQVHRLTRSVARRIASLARANRATALPPILVFKSNADSAVSTQAVVTQLLGLLDPNRHELVLFDVNRDAAKSILLVYDPRSLDLSVVGDDRLPFAVTLVTNENEESAAVVARRQQPFSATVTQTDTLGLSWPPGVISLSHVALPIPPDDPLYGQRPPDNRDVLFLDQRALAWIETARPH